MAGSAGADPGCVGCWIDGVCHNDGAPNTANPCQHCDAAGSPEAWSNNDGASCNDGNFCNGLDSCQAGGCSTHAGDPCLVSGDTCNTATNACCGDATTRVCNASGNVSEIDSCGVDLGEVEVCAATNGNCANGVCLCTDGWTGEDCSQCVRYVHPEGGEETYGLSWSDPYGTLAAALSHAGDCDIWVTEGEHAPVGTPPDATFALAPGQRLLGGFARFQMDPEDRDIDLHPTILSGDVGTPDGAGDVFSVVTMGEGAVLDGFIVTLGVGNGASITSYGGGVRVLDGSATVLNSTFLDNVAAIAGQGSVTATNCVFDSNTTGIYQYVLDATVSSCTFRGNEYGLHIDLGHTSILDSEFEAHTTSALRIEDDADATIGATRFTGSGIMTRGGMRLDNCQFSGNTGTSVECGPETDCIIRNTTFENSAGVSILVWYSATIDRCRFTNNTGTSISILEDGYGAMTTISNDIFDSNSVPVIDSAEVPGHVLVVSSTFFGNPAGVVTSADAGTRFLSNILWGNGATPITGPVTLDYNDIEGSAGTGTNFSEDPLFVSTAPGAIDLSLAAGSPCIDRAPNDTNVPATDYLGNPRYDDPAVPNRNTSGTDVGAYERQED